MTPELIGIITVGIMLAVQNYTAQREMRRDIAGLREQMADLRERMAHLEGLLDGLREAITHGRAA